MKGTEMTIEQLCYELMMLRSKAPKLIGNTMSFGKAFTESLMRLLLLNEFSDLIFLSLMPHHFLSIKS